MTKVLLLSSPIFGHVSPMLALGRGLRQRGHEVTLLTGQQVRRVRGRRGARLPAAAARGRLRRRRPRGVAAEAAAPDPGRGRPLRHHRDVRRPARPAAPRPGARARREAVRRRRGRHGLPRHAAAAHRRRPAPARLRRLGHPARADQPGLRPLRLGPRARSDGRVPLAQPADRLPAAPRPAQAAAGGARRPARRARPARPARSATSTSRASSTARSTCRSPAWSTRGATCRRPIVFTGPLPPDRARPGLRRLDARRRATRRWCT